MRLITWWQEFKKVLPTVPQELRQENKRRRAPQVSHSFSMITPLRQLKQTRFCRPFNNWRLTATLPLSTTTSVESRNCTNPSQRQCPLLTRNQRKSKCLKMFPTIVKIYNQITEEDKIEYFHSLMLVDALQALKNVTSLNRDTLGEVLAVFRKKNVKLQSIATAKHKFQRLVFNPANQKLIDLLDELQKLAKDACGVALRGSSSNSYMPKCLPIWIIQTTRRIGE